MARHAVGAEQEEDLVDERRRLARARTGGEERMALAQHGVALRIGERRVAVEGRRLLLHGHHDLMRSSRQASRYAQ
jgi:hypothetical protein